MSKIFQWYPVTKEEKAAQVKAETDNVANRTGDTKQEALDSQAKHIKSAADKQFSKGRITKEERDNEYTRAKKIKEGKDEHYGDGSLTPSSFIDTKPAPAGFWDRLTGE